MREKNFTFAVPVYNTGKYLKITLDTILNQTDGGFNIVVVDDGSTDELTKMICKEYSEKYADIITLVSQDNKGLGGARNTALKYCQTEYVLFVDSDDIVNLDLVERFNSFINDNDLTDCDMIFTLPEIFDDLRNIFTPWYDAWLFNAMANKSTVYEKGSFDEAYGLEVNFCRKIYRTKFLKDSNFKFEEHVKFEDIYPHYYLLNKCNKIAFMKGISWYYRINRPGQITASTGKGRFDMIKEFDRLKGLVFRKGSSDHEKYMYIDKVVTFGMWSENNIKKELREELSQGFSKLIRSIPKESLKTYVKYENDKVKVRYIKLKKRKMNFLIYEYKYRAIITHRLKRRKG